MHTLLRTAFAAIVALGVVSSSYARSDFSREEEAASETQALYQAASDLCSRRIALLGENGFHGDGRTTGFKSRLVQRLVQQCGFTTVMFESGRYDFLAVMRAHRRGEPLSRSMVASAVGELWNQNEEAQDLISFLFDGVESGRLDVVGLDDQLGSRGMFYSLEEMPTELSGLLEGSRGDDCRQRLRQRIWSDYPAATAYNLDARSQIRSCLSEIRSAAQARLSQPEVGSVEAMLDNFESVLARDFLPPAERLELRDAAMFHNLVASMDETGPHAKVIVWSANAHVAKTPGPLGPFAGLRNLGSLVHERYGRDAFALGFSAMGGQFRYSARANNDIVPAPEGSLEATAFSETLPEVGAVYVGSSRLSGFGTISGGAFDDHQQSPATWSDHYDGLVVFRNERPPARIAQ